MAIAVDKRELDISTLDELKALTFSDIRRRVTTVNIDALPAKQSQSLNGEIQKLSRACGCSEGAAGAIIGLFLGAVVGVSAGFGLLVLAATALTTAIVSSFVGKSLGLRMAERRLETLKSDVCESLRKERAAA